jgi:hypothetical protein
MLYKSGSQQQLINSLPSEHKLYMFMSTTHKGARGWKTLGLEEALQKLNKNSGMYEVIIHDQPRQVYFDCDFRDGDYLEEFKTLLLALMPDAELNISGSSQDYKISYHVVVGNYYFDNVDKQKCLVSFLKSERIQGKTLEKLGVDTLVYDRNRNFKCINQSKVDRIDGKATMSPYIQKYVSGSLVNKDHLVCSKNGKDAYEIFKYFHKEVSETKPLKLTPFSNTLITNTLENVVFDVETENVCKLFLTEKSLDHWDHITSLNMCNYYIQKGYSFEQYWDLRKYKRNTPEDRQKWLKNWNYQFRIEIRSKDRELELKRLILWKLGGLYTNIGLEYYSRIYRDNLDVKSTRDIKRIELVKEDLLSDKKVIVLANNMGAGKTKSLLEYSDSFQSTCIICCRTSLQKNIQSRNNNFVSYNDLKKLAVTGPNKTTQKKAKDNIPFVEKLIITPNSIHYIKDKTYEVVVIDEVEVFLNIWSMKDKLTKESTMIGPRVDGKLTNKYIDNYYTIINILKKAKKIILMDALISYRSFRYLIRSKVIESENEIEVISSSVNREPTVVKHLYVESMALDDSTEKLSTILGLETLAISIINKQRNYVFWPYVNPKSNPGITRLSQREILKWLEKRVGREILFHIYSADESKDSLLDVNENWKKVDLVLVNQSVTVGVSYENSDFLFDNVFLFDAAFVPIREIVQTSKRCRQLKEGGLMYYINLGGMFNGDYTFTNQQLDPLIKHTIIDAQNEIIAKKNFENVYFTFLRAGFRFEGVKSTKVQNFDSNLTEFLDTNYKFENIEVEEDSLMRDPDEESEQIFTLHDKLVYLKKKFCRYFEGVITLKEALCAKPLADLWNLNKDFCFVLLESKELTKLGTDEPCKLLHMQLLGLVYDQVYTDIYKKIDVKLDSSSKARLLTEMNQESLNVNTFDNVLVMKYLNSFFRTTIVKKISQQGKHTTYYVDNDAIEIVMDLIDLLETEPECLFENEAAENGNEDVDTDCELD